MSAASCPRMPCLIGSLALSLSFLVTPTLSRAQVTCGISCPGDNAVYQGSGQIPSHSFIDASQLTGTNNQTDICSKINAALVQLAEATGLNPSNSIYGGEGVVDARGISNLNCTADPINPWTGFAYGGSTPFPESTVLLPAGTIQISTTWTLPARTRLIGQGSCLGSTCTALTTIQACNGSRVPCHGQTLSGDMLQMGGLVQSVYFCPPGQNNPDRYNCNGVVIEHLRLDGFNLQVSGIDNQYSQEMSYVNDVAMINIGGEGLILGAMPTSMGFQNASNNSGPYSNLYISGAGTCVDIDKTTGTRGIHGLTCVATATVPGAAILVDGGNNTLEDVSIYGSSGSYQDGIRIGSRAAANAAATTNLLLNIAGDSNVANLVHISCAAAVSGCPSNNPNLPTDLTIMGVSRAPGTGPVTIQDDLNGTSLTDTNVGLYLVGEPVTSNGSTVLGYSRFTTSLSVPGWLVGAGAPNTTNPCPAIGDLYSNASIGNTLWGCVATPTAGWKLIK